MLKRVCYITLLNYTLLLSVVYCNQSCSDLRSFKIEEAHVIEPHYPSYVGLKEWAIHPLCLRASRDLPAGTVVATANFEPTNHDYRADHAAEDHRYVAVMDVTPEGTPVYGKVRGKWAYCNHSCEPNCDISQRWEIITNRVVRKDEELTTSYDAYVHNLPWQSTWNFDCLCESISCKKIICAYRMDIVYPIFQK